MWGNGLKIQTLSTLVLHIKDYTDRNRTKMPLQLSACSRSYLHLQVSLVIFA